MKESEEMEEDEITMKALKTRKSGNEYYTEKNYAKAEECYLEAIKFEPELGDAFYNLGLVYRAMGDNARAIVSYLKTIELSPKDAEAYNNLGCIFCEQKEYSKAKQYFIKAIELNTNYKTAYFNLGFIFRLLGEYEKAEDCESRYDEMGKTLKQKSKK